MRGVAGQEDSAYAKAVGDLGVHRPRLDRLDLNVDVGVTNGVEDVPAARLRPGSRPTTRMAGKRGSEIRGLVVVGAR